MNKRSKIRKIGLWTLVSLLLLVASVVGLIQVPSVQTYLVHKVSDRLSESIGTEVKVHAVRIDFPDFAVLENVLIRDQEKDTMFYIGELRVALRDIDRENYMIKLRKVELDDAKVYIVTHQGQEDLNMQFLIDFFTPEVPDPTAPTWIAFADKLVLKNSRFIYRNENYADPPEDRLFNENDMVISNINSVIRNFTLINDSLRFDIRNLSAAEKSGLILEEFRSLTTISSTVLAFEELLLKTPDSEIRDRIVFTYDGYGAFSEFMDSVKIEAHVDQTVLSVKDIAWFTSELNKYADQKVTLTTDFNGTVVNFSALETDMRFGRQGVFAGDILVKGLPEIDTTDLDIEFRELRFNGADLKSSFGIESIPDQLIRAGNCVASGTFHGKINDFGAVASVKSDAGNIDARIQFASKDNEPERYSGRLDVDELDLGRILDDPEMGTTSLSLVVKEGKGVSQKDFRAVFEGKVHHAMIRQYDYKDIIIDGDYTGDAFKGKASIDDENAQVVFDGKVDLNARIPSYYFAMDIRHLDLFALGLDNVPMELKAKIGCDMTGKDMNDLDGNLMVNGLQIVREGRKVNLNTIEMFAGTKDTARHLSLYSDVADVQLSGQFDLNKMGRVYEVFLNDLFPDYYTEVKPLKKPVDIDLRVRVHSSNFLTVLLDSQFIVGPGVFVGRYSSLQRSLTADARISTFKFGEERLDRIDLNIIKMPGELLNMSTMIDHVYSENELVTSQVILNASILPNEIDFLFNFAETGDDLALRSYGMAYFKGDTIQLRLEESFVYMKGQGWAVDNGNQVTYTGNEVQIENLKLFDQDQYILVNGMVGEDISDSLLIVLNDFELGNLNPILAGSGVELSGNTNGRINILQAMRTPVFSGNVSSEGLSFNGDTLGDVLLGAESYAVSPLKLKVNGSVSKGLLKDISVVGEVDMRPEKQTMALQVVMKNGGVAPLEQFLAGEVTHLTGTVSLDARVTGKFTAPKVNGKLLLENVGMTIDYFKSRYILTGEVGISENKIQIRNNTIQDVEGHKGKLNGTVHHDGFDNLNLDVKVTGLKDFVAMQTTRKDNDYFYGTAIVDGEVEVKGPIDDVYVKVNAKSKKGTHIKISLESENTNVSESYIQFVDLDKKEDEEPEEVRQKIEGFTMDLIFDVTPVAQIDLIFDAATNDVITGKGSGNIRMALNSYGDFYMYGDYVIEEGSYPYRAYFISEDFNFKKGGRISWDGDPYAARLNMEATVRKTADPTALFAGIDNGETYNTIPVDCQMFLRGELFSPEIKFGLDFPNIASNVSRPSEFMTRIREIESNEDELNRQFFAVLALGTFLPPEGSTTGVNMISGLGQQSKSSISGVMNRYVNQMLDEVGWFQGLEVGVDWANSTAEERDQVRVNVSKKLMKEKLELIGNIASRSESESQSPFEVKAIYSVTQDGRVKVQAFYKRANDPTSGVKSTTYQGGVGFYIRREMDKISFKRKKKREKSEKGE